MAKKRSSKQEKRKRAQRVAARANRLGKENESPTSIDLPDPRLMERTLGNFPGKRIFNSPVDRAQELMYDAWESRDPRKRIDLALEALDVSRDCADAYLLIADEATDSREAYIALHYAAVAAGERAIGPEAFKEDIGHFWGILETRPYMRARAGLAHGLWVLGKKDEAINHLLDMLRLNPNDNQGLRYQLLSWLIMKDRIRDARDLLDRYDGDACAVWLYSAALLAFFEHGDTEETRALISKAIEGNPHVPQYLLGQKRLPRLRPEYVGFGDDTEAISYAVDGLEIWKKTKGALEWLREATREGS